MSAAPALPVLNGSPQIAVSANDAGPATVRPVKREPLRFAHRCGECAAEFVSTRRTAQFCSDSHKQAFHNRWAERGRKIMVELCASRADRNQGELASKCWAYVRRQLDLFNREDREAGRLDVRKLAAARKMWFL